jgi:type IV secretion system protein TrbE
LIEQVLTDHGRDGFVSGWLKERDIAWATDLIPHLSELEAPR